ATRHWPLSSLPESQQQCEVPSSSNSPVMLQAELRVRLAVHFADWPRLRIGLRYGFGTMSDQGSSTELIASNPTSAFHPKAGHRMTPVSCQFGASRAKRRRS